MSSFVPVFLCLLPLLLLILLLLVCKCLPKKNGKNKNENEKTPPFKKNPVCRAKETILHTGTTPGKTVLAHATRAGVGGRKKGVGRAEERRAEGKGEGKMGWRRSGERVGQQGVGKNRVKKPPEKGVEKRPGKGG